MSRGLDVGAPGPHLGRPMHDVVVQNALWVAAICRRPVRVHKGVRAPKLGAPRFPLELRNGRRDCVPARLNGTPIGLDELGLWRAGAYLYGAFHRLRAFDVNPDRACRMGRHYPVFHQGISPVVAFACDFTIFSDIFYQRVPTCLATGDGFLQR